MLYKKNALNKKNKNYTNIILDKNESQIHNVNFKKPLCQWELSIVIIKI